MNKEMMEDLLQTIIDMQDEVTDIQTSGSRLDELVTDIEARISDVGLGLNGLQQNIRKIDQNFTTVVDGLSRKRLAAPINQKTGN